MDLECTCHNKVYAPTILLCSPPRIEWICSICGKRGQDVVGNNYNYTEHPYYKTMEKFGNISK